MIVAGTIFLPIWMAAFGPSGSRLFGAAWLEVAAQGLLAIAMVRRGFFSQVADAS
jgi:hypothetical protein